MPLKRRGSLLPTGEVRPKRQKLCDHRKTIRALLEEYRLRYSCDLNEQQVLNLCAYLSVILEWGYPLSAMNYDRFILDYRDYETSLPSLYESQLDVVNVRIPSYHTFLTDRLREGTAAPIPSRALDPPTLTQTILAEITHQHPYTVALTKEVLETVAARSVCGDYRRDLWSKLLSLEQ